MMMMMTMIFICEVVFDLLCESARNWFVVTAFVSQGQQQLTL